MLAINTVKRFDWTPLSSDDGKVPTAREWPVYGDQQPYPPMIAFGSIPENESFILIFTLRLCKVFIGKLVDFGAVRRSSKSWSMSTSIGFTGAEATGSRAGRSNGREDGFRQVTRPRTCSSFFRDLLAHYQLIFYRRCGHKEMLVSVYSMNEVRPLPTTRVLL